MNKKGQIFSVDFLISVIVIVLAIGLLLNFYELTVHAQVERNSANELKISSERAADLLVSNSEIVCELWSTETPAQRIMYLPNCLVKANNGKAITKEKLGLTEFKCDVGGNSEINAIRNAATTGCKDNSSVAKEIIAVKRMVYVTNSGGPGNEIILKQDYNDCIKNGCTTSSGVIRGPYEITLKVWKT